MADQVAHSSAAGPQMGENSQALVEKPRRPSFIMRVIFFVLILVLMASRMVPLRDVLFAVFASGYFALFGKYVYPSPTNTQEPSVFANNRIIGRYISFAALIAIFAPMAYILGSFVKGDHVAMAAAAPHLFLIACQVLSEITVVSLSTPVSLPVRMMVPVFYNTRRVFTMTTWLETEFARTADDKGWLLFGRGLAAVNMVLWAFNLFCFLLPLYFPLCMKRYSELERSSKEHQA